MAADALRGLRVLITRAAGQNAALARLVEARGGQAIFFPLLEIQPVAPADVLYQRLRQLSTADWAIFVSTNAVQAVTDALRAGRLSFPQTVNVAAIGAKTAQCCRQSGIPVQVTPSSGYGSEGLLAALAGRGWQGKRVVIFSGQQGRRLLQTRLSALGASVEQVTSYVRRAVYPCFDALLLPESATASAAVDSGARPSDIVIVPSVSILRVLEKIAADQPAAAGFMRTAAAFAYSRRIKKAGDLSGCFATVAVSALPTDESVVQAIAHYAAKRAAG